jgi:membrane-associated phospholipid phosphatase
MIRKYACCTFIIWITLFFIILSPAVVRSSDDAIEKAGDFFRIALPAIAFGSTFFIGAPDSSMWDREGTKQAVYSIGTTLVITYILKESAKKLRPNQTARNSFPSGHSSAAFSGAAFIGERYGWKWGIPAYSAAIFTAYSRVRSDWHFADDVLAGASIAMMSTWAWVTPHHSLKVLPIIIDDGLGLNVTLKSGESVENSIGGFRPNYRYTFAFGPAYLGINEVTAPSKTGTTFDLADFEKRDDPTTTAAVSLAKFLDKRNEIVFYYSPFESRDNGTFSEPVSFAGKVFPADSVIHSSWGLHDIRIRWSNTVLSSLSWGINLGAGLLFQHLIVELETDGGSVKAAVKDIVLLPLAHVIINYNFSDKLSLIIGGDGIVLPNEWMVDTGIYLNYMLDQNWDITAGYQFYDREIDNADLKNRVKYDIPFLAVAYSW